MIEWREEEEREHCKLCKYTKTSKLGVGVDVKEFGSMVNSLGEEIGKERCNGGVRRECVRERTTHTYKERERARAS